MLKAFIIHHLIKLESFTTLTPSFISLSPSSILLNPLVISPTDTWSSFCSYNSTQSFDHLKKHVSISFPLFSRPLHMSFPLYNVIFLHYSTLSIVSSCSFFLFCLDLSFSPLFPRSLPK